MEAGKEDRNREAKTQGVPRRRVCDQKRATSLVLEKSKTNFYPEGAGKLSWC